MSGGDAGVADMSGHESLSHASDCPCQNCQPYDEWLTDMRPTTLRAAETIVAWAALIALMVTCIAINLLVIVGAYTTIRWLV